MLEKSPCSLVCVTVQDDTHGELKLALKSPSDFAMLPERSMAVQTMWSYSCNCHLFGSDGHCAVSFDGYCDRK